MTKTRRAKHNPDCSCNKCKDMCFSPCLPTPEDASKLIDMGYADKLDTDYYGRQTNEIPPTDAYEGWWSDLQVNYLRPVSRSKRKHATRCVFQHGGLCKLHGICKPKEGRDAHCTMTREEGRTLVEPIYQSWDTYEGRVVLDKWHKHSEELRQTREQHPARRSKYQPDPKASTPLTGQLFQSREKYNYPHPTEAARRGKLKPLYSYESLQEQKKKKAKTAVAAEREKAQLGINVTKGTGGWYNISYTRDQTQITFGYSELEERWSYGRAPPEHVLTALAAQGSWPWTGVKVKRRRSW